MANRAGYRLGEREFDLMQVIWELGNATVNDVHEALRRRGSDLAYTTVQTMLNRLATKGALRRELDGRAYRYVPIMKEPAAMRGAIRRLVDQFFGGSSAALATHLVESGLKTADLEKLRGLIADRDREKRKA